MSGLQRPGPIYIGPPQLQFRPMCVSQYLLKAVKFIDKIFRSEDPNYMVQTASTINTQRASPTTTMVNEFILKKIEKFIILKQH